MKFRYRWCIGLALLLVLLTALFYIGGERAEYGKRIFSTLSRKLVERYGRAFAPRNLRRMVQFAVEFPELEIGSPLATQLCWSHFIEILPLNDESARLYYVKEAAERHFSRNELRRQISRKTYERQEGENSPIGIILCTTASRDQIELLELDKEGIAVAEYWTNLPPKALLERKIREILHETQERLARRKLLPNSKIQKQIEYFFEPKDDEDEDQ